MTLLADFTAMPVSSTTIALCLGIWFYEWNYRVSHETVGISYGKVFTATQARAPRCVRVCHDDGGRACRSL